MPLKHIFTCLSSFALVVLLGTTLVHAQLAPPSQGGDEPVSPIFDATSWSPDSFSLIEGDNVEFAIDEDENSGVIISAILIDPSVGGAGAFTLESYDGLDSVLVECFVSQSGQVDYITHETTWEDAMLLLPQMSAFANPNCPAVYYCSTSYAPIRTRSSWGEFWSGYWHYLTHPSEMDDDLETGFYVAVGTSAVAGTAAGGLVVAGVNPVIWGGGGAAVAGTAGAGATATTAEAVTAFGGPAAFSRLIGMGVGRAAAIARTGNITLAEIQAAGVTLTVARYWRNFYQAAVDAGRGAQTAAARVQLFDRIIELLGG